MAQQYPQTMVKITDNILEYSSPNAILPQAYPQGVYPDSMKCAQCCISRYFKAIECKSNLNFKDVF